MTYSEMISAKGIVYGDANTHRLLKIYDEEKPVALQIFGSDLDAVEEAAYRLAPLENAILDINMGCPVPKVVKNGEGSALLKDLKKMQAVCEAAVRGTRRGGSPKPVTAKIRTGWDAHNVVVREAAERLEAAGAAAICVHGRTREQFYSGRASREAIREAVEAVSIPVLGNGDVFTAEDGIELMRETGCAGVLVARGALGNPWIFRELRALYRGEPKPEPPSLAEKIAMVERHLDALIAEKGEYAGVREMRKFIGWYFKGTPRAAALRREANKAETREEVFALLKNNWNTP